MAISPRSLSMLVYILVISSVTKHSYSLSSFGILFKNYKSSLRSFSLLVKKALEFYQ